MGSEREGNHRLLLFYRLPSPKTRASGKTKSLGQRGLMDSASPAHLPSGHLGVRSQPRRAPAPCTPVPSTCSPQGREASCCPGRLPIPVAVPVVPGPTAAAWRSARAGLHHARSAPSRAALTCLKPTVDVGWLFFPPLQKSCFSSLKCFGFFFPLTPHPSLPTQGKLCERLHTRLCNWRAADHPEMRATTSSLHHLRESAPGPVDSSTPPSAQTRRKARHQKRKSPSTLLPCGMMRTPVSPHGDFPPLSFIDTGASYNGNSITVALVGPWSLPAPPESPGGVNGPPLLCQGSCPASPCSVLSAEDPQTPCTLRTGRGGGRPFAISLSPVGRCFVPPAPRWWAAHHSWQHRGMLAKVPLEETIFKHTFRLV